MPIIKVTQDKQTKYVGVRELEDGTLDSNATNKRHIVAEYVDRGDVLNALQCDYLDRLEQHARDCALLEHLVENPPQEDSASMLRTLSLLAGKVTADAIDLRTYDPFVTLTADLEEPKKAHGYPQFVTDTHRFALNPGDPANSWSTAWLSLRESGPSRLAAIARDAERKREQDKARNAALPRRTRKAVNAFMKAYTPKKRTKKRKAA